MKILLYVMLMVGLGLIAHPVRAARAVPGVVPSVSPLFPTPVGVEPNLKGNVQHQGESVLQDPASSATAESVTDPVVEPGAGGVGVPDAQRSAPVGERVSWKWVLFAGAVILLGFGMWVVFRKRRTNV